MLADISSQSTNRWRVNLSSFKYYIDYLYYLARDGNDLLIEDQLIINEYHFIFDQELIFKFFKDYLAYGGKGILINDQLIIDKVLILQPFKSYLVNYINGLSIKDRL